MARLYVAQLVLKTRKTEKKICQNIVCKGLQILWFLAVEPWIARQMSTFLESCKWYMIPAILAAKCRLKRIGNR